MTIANTHTDRQTYKNTHANTNIETDTHTCIYIYLKRHTHRDTQAHTENKIHTHTNMHTQQTDKQMHMAKKRFSWRNFKQNHLFVAQKQNFKNNNSGQPHGPQNIKEITRGENTGLLDSLSIDNSPFIT